MRLGLDSRCQVEMQLCVWARAARPRLPMLCRPSYECRRSQFVDLSLDNDVPFSSQGRMLMGGLMSAFRARVDGR